MCSARRGGVQHTSGRVQHRPSVFSTAWVCPTASGVSKTPPEHADGVSIVYLRKRPVITVYLRTRPGAQYNVDVSRTLAGACQYSGCVCAAQLFSRARKMLMVSALCICKRSFFRTRSVSRQARLEAQSLLDRASPDPRAKTTKMRTC